jgi:hypothetical protein
MKGLMFKKKLLSLALAALAVPIAVTRPASAQTSVVYDPVGDVKFHAPAFEDIVRSQIQKKGGSFILQMEMASFVPANPPLSNGTKEVWWAWAFDLDPAISAKGYPFAPGFHPQTDFLVYVSWDGTEYRGFAIDRRPLLTGGNAIVTPVPFSVDGATVEAIFPSALINNLASFRWGTRTFDWKSSHLDTQGFNPADIGGDLYNPFP